MTLLVLAATGVAHVFAIAVAAAQMARVQTSTTVFASEKVEALRAVAWGSAALAVTSADALDSNLAGSVEHLDARGTVVSLNTAAPPAGRFIRRWSVQPLLEDPANALVLQVLVTSAEADRRAARPRQRTAGDALVTTILARQAR